MAITSASRGLLGPDGGESVVEGTDFARIEGGRLKSVVGFLDKVPAKA